MALAREFKQPGPPPPEGLSVALEAWDLMGGRIDWAALDTVSALLGAEDVELLIARLIAIRDHAASIH